MKTIYKNLTIQLHPDYDIESPLDCQDDNSQMIFAVWLRNSTLSDQNPFKDPKEATDYARSYGYEVFKVRGYHHSGVAYSCDPIGSISYPFDCPFDAGFAGFVLIKKSAFPERKKEAKGLRQKVANGLCETVTAYANGDGCWYEVLDDAGEMLDSCCGYFHADDAIQAAKEWIDNRTGV